MFYQMASDGFKVRFEILMRKRESDIPLNLWKGDGESRAV